MLKLRRGRDDGLTITAPDGTQLRVVVLDVDRRKNVMLGIDAPRDWRIKRDELPEIEAAVTPDHP